MNMKKTPWMTVSASASSLWRAVVLALVAVIMGPAKVAASKTVVAPRVNENPWTKEGGGRFAGLATIGGRERSTDTFTASKKALAQSWPTVVALRFGLRQPAPLPA